MKRQVHIIALSLRELGRLVLPRSPVQKKPGYPLIVGRGMIL
jgi:hypothetical protein